MARLWARLVRSGWRGGLVPCLFALACHGTRDITRRALPERDVFIAMERDFQEFRSWGSLALPEAEAQGLTHRAGPGRVYANALPPVARPDFPVGTVLVKETVPDRLGRVRLLAMVKRGGGFNARGARGWEWFELEERSDHRVGIVWRGLGAPGGEEYGGDPDGTCNSCHGSGGAHDFVRSAALAPTRG